MSHLVVLSPLIVSHQRKETFDHETTGEDLYPEKERLADHHFLGSEDSTLIALRFALWVEKEIHLFLYLKIVSTTDQM